MKNLKNIALLAVAILLFGACYSSRSITGTNAAAKMGTANTTSGLVDSIVTDTIKKNN